MPSSIPLPIVTALWMFVAWALVVSTEAEDMPGGGMPALVIRSALWPFIAVIAALGMLLVVLGVRPKHTDRKY